MSAIGFKAVHGGRISGVQRVTPEVLAAMEEMNDVAPAHNPPYIAAMRLLSEKLPEIPLVAAFETDFHQTIPDRNRYYAGSLRMGGKWHVRRCGFHGASHRYIATRTAELLGRGDLRIISCHLGGSSSLVRDSRRPKRGHQHGHELRRAACRRTIASATSIPSLLPVLMKHTGKSLGRGARDPGQRERPAWA